MDGIAGLPGLQMLNPSTCQNFIVSQVQWGKPLLNLPFLSYHTPATLQQSHFMRLPGIAKYF